MHRCDGGKAFYIEIMLKSLNFFHSFFKLIFNKLDINQWKIPLLVFVSKMSKEKALGNFAFKRNIKMLGNHRASPFWREHRLFMDSGYVTLPKQHSIHTNAHHINDKYFVHRAYTLFVFVRFVTIFVIWSIAAGEKEIQNQRGAREK